ncbi:uncharacterized protein (TIGR02265 family) [Archangium gephyra]|uniref:Uncharacterized protein (TIGR02265 family) n=1 Tax=Archangium gephyra TaxID=48 RepID=A0AAC8Q5M0_9BACT|nr:DUF2378 family protein [Archangium gephyra]AKJ01503.1 Hypothetical protein AA314_03129 [Archangium gephyra]REG34319.1 uncharacterized protein (TIGR02265 family) [Archangium gephyra]
MSSPSAPGLEQLLTLATPMDTCRGLFFNGVFEAVRSLGGEEARVRCYGAVGEKKYVDFFSYPVADFLKTIFSAAEVLGGQGGRSMVLRQLGRRATADFLHSTVGKTMMALAGTDPQRLLASFPSAYRASLSYGDRSVERLGEKQARLMARRDFLPLEYNEGVLHAAMEHSTARDLVVRGRQLAPLDADYDISWS